MSDKTSIGDRMKSYEAPTTSRVVFKGQPLVVRLDGKAFHTFTKGMARPFDQKLSDLMVGTTKALVDRFHALVGYCQSDEITLVWYLPSESSAEYPFAGRLQKVESLTAAFATAWFNRNLGQYFPDKVDALPTFDSRAFVVPNLMEAYHAVLWRQQDCTKNAISMAAQSMFSHKALQNKNGPAMQEMMFSQHGVNFNDYPSAFKRGVFAKRIRRERPLTADEKAKMPPHLRNDEPVVRSSIEIQDLWLSRIQNDRLKVLFGDEEPVYTGEITN